jgi:hypothetical protein
MRKPARRPRRRSRPPGTGSGSALPPADTPQGAKIRTEKAMEKDEQRTRNAPGVQDGSAKLKGGL